MLSLTVARVDRWRWSFVVDPMLQEIKVRQPRIPIAVQHHLDCLRALGPVGRLELADCQLGGFLVLGFMIVCSAAFTFGCELVGTVSRTLANLCNQQCRSPDSEQV